MTALSIVAILLLAITMGLSLAHALEFPGKLRLDEQTYRAVQTIYYPGFTFGGLIGELGGLLVLPALLFVTPYGSVRFWWTATAFGFLILAHATYWLVTHPVNSAWLKSSELSRPGAAFFSTFKGKEGNWMHMRNAWEYSHVARACFAAASLVSMTLALALAENG